MSNKHKLIPKRRFKEFANADAWEQRKLGEEVQIVMGQSPKGENYTDNREDYILVQGNADMKEGKVFPRVWTTQVTKKAYKGDIILSVRAPVGDIGKTDYDVVIGRGVAAVKGNEFFYQLLGKLKQDGYWTKSSTGSTFDSINSNEIKDAKVTIPDANEQLFIGNYFKEMDNLITLHQRKLYKLKILKSAYLSEIIPVEGELNPKRRFPGFAEDWEKKKVSDMFKVTRGQVLSMSLTSRIQDKTNKYPVYSSQTKDDGLMGYYSEYLFDTAITWTTDGANAGTVNYRKGKFFSTNVNGVLLSNDGYCNKAVSEILNLVAYKYVSKVGNPKLMNNVMEEIIISVPRDKNEMNIISDFLIAFDEKISFLQKKINKLEDLKKSYLNEMFV